MDEERRRREAADIRWEMNLIRAMFRMPLDPPEEAEPEPQEFFYCDVCDTDARYCEDKEKHPRSRYAPRS